jgi:DNA repair protein RAD16
MEALAELNNLRLLLDHPYLLQYDRGWEIVSDVSVRRSEAVWGTTASSSLTALIASGQFQTSSKLEAIMEQLRGLESDSKILMFSCFERFLQLVAFCLDREGISYASYTGKVSKTRRRQALVEFRENKGPRVLLLTLGAGGEGLNIQSADTVFVLDPWWNPFAEMQAIGRSYRVGQTRSVRVVHFITRDSVEEYIREIQERKKTLVNFVVNGNIDPHQFRGLTMKDLRNIFKP